MNPLIEINEYNPEWPVEYEREKETITNEIREYITSIHHIGSTAVEGLRSKAIIDIAVEIKEYPPNQKVIEALERLEYINMGEAGFERRYWFKKGDPRKYHLHIMEENSEITKRLVAFRDLLKNNKDIAKVYETLKISKSAGKVLDSNDYAISKNRFIQAVLKEH